MLKRLISVSEGSCINGGDELCGNNADSDEENSNDDDDDFDDDDFEEEGDN